MIFLFYYFDLFQFKDPRLFVAHAILFDYLVEIIVLRIYYGLY